MDVKCPGCGIRLMLEPGQHVCEYCGSTIDVAGGDPVEPSDGQQSAESGECEGKAQEISISKELAAFLVKRDKKLDQLEKIAMERRGQSSENEGSQDQDQDGNTVMLTRDEAGKLNVVKRIISSEKRKKKVKKFIDDLLDI